MKKLSQLLSLAAHHPNPVTRCVYREILGTRLDRIEQYVEQQEGKEKGEQKNLIPRSLQSKALGNFAGILGNSLPR